MNKNNINLYRTSNLICNKQISQHIRERIKKLNKSHDHHIIRKNFLYLLTLKPTKTKSTRALL